MSLPEQIQKAFDAKYAEVGEDAWHDIGNDKIFEFGWQAATSECVKLLDEQDKAYSQQTNALIKRHAEQLEEAKNRINDMLLSDDGQAHKEARKFIERIEVAQPAQEPSESESEKAWSYAVATIIGVYLNEPVDSEKCKAIGAIIERRLWSLPQPRKEPLKVSENWREPLSADATQRLKNLGVLDKSIPPAPEVCSDGGKCGAGGYCITCPNMPAPDGGDNQ